MKADEARALAKETLSEERFYHTECVAEAAKALALRYGEDPERAETAGFLHDIAKEFEEPVLLQMIKSSDIIRFGEVERCPKVWHACAGGVFAERHTDADPEIVSAIASHTTGRAGMTQLEKIVFVADFISIDRDFEELEEIRKLAFESLDLAALSIIESQVLHILKHRRYMDVNIIRAYNDLLTKREETGEN